MEQDTNVSHDSAGRPWPLIVSETRQGNRKDTCTEGEQKLWSSSLSIYKVRIILGQNYQKSSDDKATVIYQVLSYLIQIKPVTDIYLV